MKEIKLTKGMVAFVDDEDYELVSQYKWRASASLSDKTKKYYAKRNDIRMHRFIMNAPEGVEVDHINGNGLDNRRCNLRLATRSQNSANSIKQSGTSSRYKGVSWEERRQRWLCRICLNKKQRFLGYFFDEEEAARVYDESAKELFGEFANLNFKDTDGN